MNKAIFGVVASAALVAMVAIPSAAHARRYHHAVSDSFGLVRGVELSWNECSQRALNLGLIFGQSGNGDYMRECTTGRPSGGTRQRNGGA
jgi:hypothetical protein